MDINETLENIGLTSVIVDDKTVAYKWVTGSLEILYNIDDIKYSLKNCDILQENSLETNIKNVLVSLCDIHIRKSLDVF